MIDIDRGNGQHDRASGKLSARRSTLVVGMFLGVFVAISAIGVAWIVLGRDSLPLLSESDLVAARDRWRRHGPASYDLDLQLAGNRPGIVHVEVRAGQVTRMTRDGVEPRQRRTWDYWTVPAMFDTIDQELAMAQDGVWSSADPALGQAELRAVFDPRFGYPLRYHRVVSGKNLETAWTVTGFRVLNEDGEVYKDNKINEENEDG